MPNHHINPAFILPCQLSTHKSFKNLTGKTFERLYVESFAGKRVIEGKATYYWQCQCVCGKKLLVNTANLSGGFSKSCGCLAADLSSVRNCKHGKWESAEYRVWSGMRARACNQKGKQWAQYGGRGITICERWKNSFQNFYDDMGPRPSNDHSIDRIDNNGPYCKENCRWATRIEQMRNTRTNRFITLNGVTLCASSERTRLGNALNRDGQRSEP